MRKDLKMIAIDLDGTLLRDDCTISERTREAVEEAGRKGYLIVPTTGRSYRNARFVLKDFREISYFINGNGSVITDGRTGDVLYFMKWIWTMSGRSTSLRHSMIHMWKSMRDRMPIWM